MNRYCRYPKACDAKNTRQRYKHDISLLLPDFVAVSKIEATIETIKDKSSIAFVHSKNTANSFIIIVNFSCYHALHCPVVHFTNRRQG